MSTNPYQRDRPTRSGRSRAELLAEITRLEAESKAAYAEQVRLVTEMLAERGGTAEGRQSLLADMLNEWRIDPEKARELLRLAEAGQAKE